MLHPPYEYRHLFIRGWVSDMPSRITEQQADAEFRASELVPLTPFTRLGDEREATCSRCGTWRRVTLRSIRDSACAACRWCTGWDKWVTWGVDTRKQQSAFRTIRGPEFSASQIRITGLKALTRLGDEFTPVGCLCIACGETLVTVPERIDPRRPDWFSCQRCLTAKNRAARTQAAGVYADAGLRLLDSVRGQWTRYPAECLKCGNLRHVSYQQVISESAPACWTCSYGIRLDEPHRVYLFRFPALGVLKVGITHNRHDGRLIEHAVQGGQLVETIVVADRHAALAIEAWVLATKSAWLRSVGAEHFPQGGWTEAWSEADSPAVSLAEIYACTSGTSRGHVSR
jgi:hypothetical protein